MMDAYLLFLGQVLSASLATIVVVAALWWAINRAVCALGLSATVVSYAAHRAVLRWLLGSHFNGKPRGCIACGVMGDPLEEIERLRDIVKMQREDLDDQWARAAGLRLAIEDHCDALFVGHQGAITETGLRMETARALDSNRYNWVRPPASTNPPQS